MTSKPAAMAGASPSAPSARSARSTGASPRLPGVRWDRIARLVLLGVLLAILALYIGPARSYLETWNETKAKSAQLEALERENAELERRHRALKDPQTIELEARKLGMVDPDERPYSVTGLGRDGR